MKKKRRVTDRQWSWDGSKYSINYQWDDAAFDRLWNAIQSFEYQDSDPIDDELTALDLLETVVDDSANREAIAMLDSIGIKC